MNTALQTFMRYEKKYLLSSEQLHSLMRSLKGRMEPDCYGEETITNVYYDTFDYALIRHSLEGPAYKEKLRLRSYGRAGADETVFAEIKKKCKGIVYKRRTAMPLNEAEIFLRTGITLLPMDQVRQEIRYMTDFWRVEPKAYIAYDREAYVDPMGSDLRITFDCNIRCRSDRLSLAGPTDGEQLTEKGQTLMEIKVPGAFPLWLSQALSENAIYPTSFSKYGQYYRKIILDTQERMKHHVA